MQLANEEAHLHPERGPVGHGLGDRAQQGDRGEPVGGRRRPPALGAARSSWASGHGVGHAVRVGQLGQQDVEGDREGHDRHQGAGLDPLQSGERRGGAPVTVWARSRRSASSVPFAAQGPPGGPGQGQRLKVGEHAADSGRAHRVHRGVDLRKRAHHQRRRPGVGRVPGEVARRWPPPRRVEPTQRGGRQGDGERAQPQRAVGDAGGAGSPPGARRPLGRPTARSSASSVAAGALRVGVRWRRIGIGCSSSADWHSIRPTHSTMAPMATIRAERLVADRRALQAH